MKRREGAAGAGGGAEGAEGAREGGSGRRRLKVVLAEEDSSRSWGAARRSSNKFTKSKIEYTTSQTRRYGSH